MRPELGIEKIASYIPEGRIDNSERKGLFSIDDKFIEEKLGVRKIAFIDEGDDVPDPVSGLTKNWRQNAKSAAKRLTYS